MKLLPLLLFVCFVLYEVLQVEGKSKHDGVKKLLQKYIHHHKHHHHHHKHHVHHHHHHHKHHHHKHLHHHHHHHHKSFHQKLVERLKKEKLRQHHQQNVVKATKRESLPELLVSLGKGFMKLGKNLGKNESHANVQATKASAIKHVPTPKSLVQDHVATTRAARAFATPSPTSEYHNENDDSDDIGRDALTSAPTTPTVSQTFTPNQDQERTGPHHKSVDSPIITPQPSQSPKTQATSDDISPSLNSDSSHSRKQERIPHPKNVDSPTFAPTSQSEPSPSPSPKPQATRDDFSPSESDEKEKTLNSTMDPTASRISKPNQDEKPKMAPVLDKENESVSSKDGLDKSKGMDENRDSSKRAKGIDGHRDGSKPKIPEVIKEESVPNPRIEIPADQARLLEHSPTESAIDGREENESFHSEQESQFVNSTSSENPSPNLFVSEPSVEASNPGRLEMNATQSADYVEPVVEDDLSSNVEARGTATVSTPESINETVPAPGSFDKLDGEQTREASQPKSEDKAQVVETKPEDSQAEENIDGNFSAASEKNLNTESKTAEVNSTASDEIMDGEVSPSEIIAENVDDLSSKSSTLSPAAAGLRSSTESTDSVAMPSSQGSDSATDKTPVKPATGQVSENTFDADHEVGNQASQETNGNMGGASQLTSSSDDDSTGKSLSTESDDIADQTKMTQPTTPSDGDSATSSESDGTTDQLKMTQSTTTSHDDSTAKPLFAKSDSTTGQLQSQKTTQSGITKEELAKPSTQESDSTDEEAQPTGRPVKPSDESVQASTHGADDITGERPSHDAEALKDGSGTSEDDTTSDLDDGKTAPGVANLQPSNQHSEYNAPELSPVSNSTLAVGDSENSTSDDVSTQPNPQSESTETSSQSDSQSDVASTQPNPQSKIETPSLSSSRSDDVVGGSSQQTPAPVYQNYTTLDSQENDDTAQLSEVPIDEAYNPTAEHLVDDTTQDDQNKVTNKVNSFPSEIVDGEVPLSNTSLYNTGGFNTYNSTVPAVYN